MIKRRVSIILFHDDKGNILLQDRREISKHGEEYGLFGGKIEDGETEEWALKREMREELNLEINKYTLFKHSKEIIKEIDREVERFIFLAHLPDLTKIIKIRKISDSAINLRIPTRNSDGAQKPRVFDMAKSVRRFFPQRIFKPSEMQEAFLSALIIFDDEVTKNPPFISALKGGVFWFFLIIVHEGKLAFTTFEKSFKFKMVP